MRSVLPARDARPRSTASSVAAFGVRSTRRQRAVVLLFAAALVVTAAGCGGADRGVDGAADRGNSVTAAPAPAAGHVRPAVPGAGVTAGSRAATTASRSTTGGRRRPPSTAAARQAPSPQRTVAAAVRGSVDVLFTSNSQQQLAATSPPTAGPMETSPAPVPAPDPSAEEVLAPHRGAVGRDWNKGERPTAIPVLVIAPRLGGRAEQVVSALNNAGLGLERRTGSAASADLAALLDKSTIVSVARYRDDVGAKVGYGIVLEFQSEEAAISQARVLSDARRSHLPGDAVLIRAGAVIAGYIPAPGQPDRAQRFYDAVAAVA
jgi:hypothetical protein